MTLGVTLVWHFDLVIMSTNAVVGSVVQKTMFTLLNYKGRKDMCSVHAFLDAFGFK